MPQRDSAPLGAPCWIDLYTSDPARCQEFYGRLLGWTAQSAGPEYGGYLNFSKDGLPVAGCMKNDGESGSPDVWSVYLRTGDARATVDAAVANGGQVVVPAMEVMGLGSMAVLTDVGGAVVGAWQPGAHKGFGILGEPGTPYWFELQTRDYNASVKFYEAVFAWDAHTRSDTPDLRYTTLGQGESSLAGIIDATSFLPEGVPAHCQVMFAAEDADAALATVEERGGSIFAPAQDTPYGRVAQAADPTGASFRIISKS